MMIYNVVATRRKWVLSYIGYYLVIEYYLWPENKIKKVKKRIAETSNAVNMGVEPTTSYKFNV
jgi:hypothetical protein